MKCNNLWVQSLLRCPMWDALLIWAATWDFQQCDMCDKQRLRPACAYAQSDQSLCLSLEYSMTVKLLIEHNLEFLSLKGGCTGSSESALVNMPHCWKSRVMAHMWIFYISGKPWGGQERYPNPSSTDYAHKNVVSEPCMTLTADPH